MGAERLFYNVGQMIQLQTPNAISNPDTRFDNRTAPASHPREPDT